MKILSSNDLTSIQALERNEVAFPEIDFTNDVELRLGSPTIKGAYTNITKKVGFKYFDDIDWNEQGDVEWQNNMLQWLSASIDSLICDYFTNPNVDLLTRIFIRIQLWGGRESRYPFVKGGGFNENFDPTIYAEGVDLIREGKYYEANIKIGSLGYVATAFATKHLFFWSRNKAPIFDSLIAKIVFGRKSADERFYGKYVKIVSDLANDLDTTSNKIERNLFNWADTEEGRQWIKLRMKE